MHMSLKSSCLLRTWNRNQIIRADNGKLKAWVYYVSSQKCKSKFVYDARSFLESWYNMNEMGDCLVRYTALVCHDLYNKTEDWHTNPRASGFIDRDRFWQTDRKLWIGQKNKQKYPSEPHDRSEGVLIGERDAIGVETVTYQIFKGRYGKRNFDSVPFLL